ncbi:MAG TPA: DUF934 domain-containing protein [Xanthobacteraceae bacterium]|jgi:uncharacterized protein (DUF934 family)|nr:DUF934 domain-containing protein [Xanthobacteraceae bacterium]
MPLVKNGQITHDQFVFVSDESPISDSGPVVVSAARFLTDPESLLRRNANTGVLWPNNRKISELAPYLDRLGLVALVFPNFRDGRAYSQARLLRERYGYRGELRATGQILRDQFLFLLRAGFDTLDVLKEADVPAMADVLRRYSVFYQPTGDGRLTAAQARLSQHQTYSGIGR